MRSRWVLKKLQCVNDSTHRWQALVGPGKDPICPICGGAGERDVVYQPLSPTVIDDQIEGGPRFVHNLGHDPVWIETKSQLAAEMKARRLQPMVRHVGVPGTDKSPITTSWSLPSTQDARPFCMLSPEEQVVRRAEAAERFGLSVAELERISYGDADDASRQLEFVERAKPSVTFTPDRE